MYESYFSKIPQGNQSKSGLQSAHNMLQFYADIRELVIQIFRERGQLTENVRFLQEKIDHLGMDKSYMILFYGFKHKYQNMVNYVDGLSDDVKKQVQLSVDTYMA